MATRWVCRSAVRAPRRSRAGSTNHASFGGGVFAPSAPFPRTTARFYAARMRSTRSDDSSGGVVLLRRTSSWALGPALGGRGGGPNRNGGAIAAAARRGVAGDAAAGGKPGADAAAAGAAAAPTESAAASERASNREARRRAYAKYRERNSLGIGLLSFFRRRSAGNRGGSERDSVRDRNVRLASYAAAAVVGALGATYASVPLYKMFCQATGFGGTTQRVTLTEWAEKREEREESGKTDRTGKISQAMWEKLTSFSNVPAEMLPRRGQSHGRGGPKTWTDEEAAARLASLKPVEGGRLITVRFDSTVGDVMPWSFTPTQLDVKVVPGETALSFFTATNHSKDRAITGVATYNVHPPRAGLYFNKIQCFCFEEQRLLPGETVDMPVFFFVDPEYADDPQLATCNNITLSYTFFQTDEDDDEDDEEDDDEDDEDDDGGGEGEGGSGAERGPEVDGGDGGTKRGWWRGWLGR